MDNKVDENALEKKAEVEVLEQTTVLNVEEVNKTAEEIVKQAEAEANKAAEIYNNKSAPVAPQQDRIQLVDTEPKLHAVQFGGVTMSTVKKEENEKSPALDDVTDKKKVDEVNNNGPSKGKVLGLVIMFIGLLAVVLFLPDIKAYIDTQKYLRSQTPVEDITSGTLECTMDNSSDNLDYTYTFSFSFVNKELTRLKSVSEIRGDVSLDEVELEKLKSECDLLNTVVKDISGISVSCKLANGLVTKSQIFNFSSIVVDDAITAYIEAGGQYPNYRIGDNIDEIEKNLLSSNYNCKRFK